jgi:four helix bundle protein
MRDYHALTVWKRAHEVTLGVYALAKRLPTRERYILSDQMRRAAVSVASNIAEATGRSSRRDGARFLSIAAGSASELEYQLELVAALGLSESQDHLLGLIGEVKRMLTSLIGRWSIEPGP